MRTNVLIFDSVVPKVARLYTGNRPRRLEHSRFGISVRWNLDWVFSPTHTNCSCIYRSQSSIRCCSRTEVIGLFGTGRLRSNGFDRGFTQSDKLRCNRLAF
jgi:hypothetical protein